MVQKAHSGPEASGTERLDSWKEIAAYLKRDESTVRRWEKEGLPVHRLAHEKKPTVYAYKSEIDAWWTDGRVGPEVPEARPTTRGRKTTWWIIGGSLLLSAGFVIALNIGGIRDRILRRPTVGEIRSIAVLPLENLSGDPQQEYFADGMTEALITELAKISALRVISRQSMMQYKGSKKSAPQIAKELNVEAVVEGSVLRAGDRVRISVQLIQGVPERHLWANTYDRDLRDVLALHSEMARAVVGEVRAKLTQQEQRFLVSKRSVDPKVYEAYLKGRRYLWFGYTDEDDKQTMRFFNEALALDPLFAPAHAGSAELSIMHAANYAKTGTAAEGEWDRARASALKALELDDSLGEAHAALGEIQLVHDWNWAAAESSVKRATALDPSSLTAHLIHVEYLMAMTRFNEARERCSNYTDVDPAAPINFNWFGMAYYNLGDYDRALEQWEAALKLMPKFWAPRMWQGFAYLQKGMDAEALAAARDAEKWAEEAADATHVSAMAAHVYGRLGMKQKALRTLKRLEELSRNHHPQTFYLQATVYAGLGDKDQAFKSLDKAFQERSPLLFNLRFVPGFGPLRKDPRFQDLVRRMNFPLEPPSVTTH